MRGSRSKRSPKGCHSLKQKSGRSIQCRWQALLCCGLDDQVGSRHCTFHVWSSRLGRKHAPPLIAYETDLETDDYRLAVITPSGIVAHRRQSLRTYPSMLGGQVKAESGQQTRPSNSASFRCKPVSRRSPGTSACPANRSSGQRTAPPSSRRKCGYQRSTAQMRPWGVQTSDTAGSPRPSVAIFLSVFLSIPE